MILEKFKLDGKTVLVTGCKKGMGRAYAKALAEAGANIIGVDMDVDLKEVQGDVRHAGKEFFGYVCDFSERKVLYSFIKKVKTDFPRIDILINNAGTILRASVAEHPDDYWDKVIEVNLNAQFVLTREIGKEMVKRGKGKIIFIASLLTYQGGITVPGYAASKGGVGQLTKAFANEWAAKGVNVNAIAPGYITTDNTAPLRADTKRNKAILERIPAGRWGNVDDMTGTIVFLSSSASDYVHGTIITVDGGWMGR